MLALELAFAKELGDTCTFEMAPITFSVKDTPVFILSGDSKFSNYEERKPWSKYEPSWYCYLGFIII